MPAGRPQERGIADDELFLSSPSNSSAPIVEPLRINKRHSSQTAVSQQDSPPATNPYPYRRPTGGYPGVGPPGSTPGPTGPASPTLPYPDRPAAERMQFGQQPDGQLPYPLADERTHGSPYERMSSPTPSATSISSSASSQPARHVSKVHSEAYPTPPPFRHREGRPPGLRRDSRTESPPQAQASLQPPSVNTDGPPPLNPYPQFHQQYWPPSRMTSTSTTAARRGSPPPPETPATATSEHPPAQFGAVPTGGQQQSPAAYQPNAYYSSNLPSELPSRPTGYTPPPAQSPPQPQAQSQPPPQSATSSQGPPRPWTPTEAPGSYPHGPPTVWHGTGGQNSVENLHNVENQRRNNGQSPEALEQDFQRLNVTASPPPSYASLSHASGAASNANNNSPATTAQGYPDEKRTVVVGAAAPEMPPNRTHPAFHNDPTPEQQQQSQQQAPTLAQPQPQPQPQVQPQPQPQPQSQPQSHPQPQPQSQPELPQDAAAQHPGQHFSPPPVASPTSPPPLPEGWIAHMDSNSGQYYYIHLATSHTQWEPPALPLTSESMVQPGPSTTQTLHSPGYANVPPLGSPGFPPPSMGYHDSTMSTISPPPSMPTTPGFPPPTPGFPPHTPLPVGLGNVYKTLPSNSEYFGPYLRYTNMELEHGIWYGSIMLITEYQQAPTIHLHMSVDLSPNPRQLKANPIYTYKTWTFYRYDIEIQMGDVSAMWTYAISTPLGCTRFEYLVAGRGERNWRFFAHSCNDFSLGVKGEERARLGGHGAMWKDLMQKQIECGGFHAQLGLGNQIYADRMWKEVPCLREWTEIRGKENRKNAAWTQRHEEDVNAAYFHIYCSTWDQPHLREALAQIPHIFQLDDHDIFDGFGGYPEYMQFSNMFKNIGRLGTMWYLLFQHHTTLDMLHSSTEERDLFTITGTGWHFIKYLGPSIVAVGLDTRSERNQHQVLAGPTYQGFFPKIATLPQSVQHALLMVAVPVIYPRTETAEQFASTVATGKKAVTGTYNFLGKVVGSAAGVVGGKEMVGSGFQSLKKAVGKHGLMSGMVSIFGEVDLLDDLRDHWTHESKDLERTYLIRTLQGISLQRRLRFTFVSGDVHCAGAGLVYDPNKPSDPKTMYQIITSAIVNAPPPSIAMRFLQNNKPLFVPQNGYRSNHQPSDTKEEMIELFQTDPDGRVREYRRLMPRRNYAIFTAFEGELGGGGPLGMQMGMQDKNLSIAVDFIVQGEGAYAGTYKYGPVVVPKVDAFSY